MAKSVRGKTKLADWLAILNGVVRKKPIVLLRFDADEWGSLQESRGGTNRFTVARRHAARNAVRVPTVCLLVGENHAGEAEIHCGVLQSRTPVTTLESRLKVVAAQPVSPSSEEALLALVTDRALKPVFRRQLETEDSVITLSPAVSVHLVKKLSDLPESRRALRGAAASLDAPKRYSGNRALQEDAISLALKAFGLSLGDNAAVLEIADSEETGLAGVPVREDAVIEHDARVVPGFTFIGSDLTGRAVFRNGNDVLEVITANKRPLEEAFGVDLIYLNARKHNVVMVQYKMLNPARSGYETDWLYRPDSQFNKEMARMKLFSDTHVPGQLEYRINPQVFYLRFVRRDAQLGRSAVTMPIDQFEVLRGDPACKGPKGAFRISYNTLDGRYLRQDGFLDLVSAGYIGAYAKGTGDLTTLIDATLKRNRAIVVAVQSSVRAQP